MEKNYFKGYFYNDEGLKKEIAAGVEELLVTGEKDWVIGTLVGSSFGSYAGEALFELFNYPAECPRGDEGHWEEVDEFLYTLNDHFIAYLESAGITIPVGFFVFIGFNEHDGAIDIFLGKEEE